MQWHSHSSNESITDAVREYGRRSGEIWHSMQKSMPEDLGSKR